MKWHSNYIHELKMMWKEPVITYFKTLPHIYLEGQKKTNPIQVAYEQDSNQGPSEYDTEILNVQ
jgi:hypothetical protein